jgi:hypothetical protein
MVQSTYYEDRRYCCACRRYVHYLESPLGSYCSSCGGPVKLFSPQDLESFRRSLEPERAGRDAALKARA